MKRAADRPKLFQGDLTIPIGWNATLQNLVDAPLITDVEAGFLDRLFDYFIFSTHMKRRRRYEPGDICMLADCDVRAHLTIAYRDWNDATPYQDRARHIVPLSPLHADTEARYLSDLLRRVEVSLPRAEADLIHALFSYWFYSGVAAARYDQANRTIDGFPQPLSARMTDSALRASLRLLITQTEMRTAVFDTQTKLAKMVTAMKGYK